MIPVILLESSSPSALAPQTVYSTLQVVRSLFAGAPVHPVLPEDEPPVSFEEMLDRVAEGRVRGVLVGTLNTFLRACGRIPMLHPVPNHAPQDAGQQPAAPADDDVERRLIPVVCTFCNCAFCFPDYVTSVLAPAPGFTYTRLPGPATPDLNTSPLVGPLCGVDGALPAEGQPVPLTVCPDRHHFAVAMGKMDLPRDALPVEWRRPSALGVVPVAVGTRGGGGGVLQRKDPAPEVDGSSGEMELEGEGSTSGAPEGSPSPNA